MSFRKGEAESVPLSTPLAARPPKSRFLLVLFLQMNIDKFLQIGIAPALTACQAAVLLIGTLFLHDGGGGAHCSQKWLRRMFRSGHSHQLADNNLGATVICTSVDNMPVSSRR